MNMIPMGQYLALMILAFLLSIGSSVLLGLCVYYDARARMNENPAMWGVLCGVLGPIPGIIYLCTRNNARNRMILCQNCGWQTPLFAPACLHCGAPNYYAQQAVNPTAGQDAKRARALLIAWIAAVIAVVVLGIISFSLFLTDAVAYSTQHSTQFPF